MIGILDVKGSLPCFEDFGNLPTKIIDENNYKEIKDLELLIIPGGSLIESGLREEIKKEIINFDGYIFGVCSGFQLLGKKIDIGRKSPIPIIREGLNLLDVEFSPLVCTDRVRFKSIFGEGEGFHCHTYGNVKVGKDKVFTVSYVQKLNYKFNEKEIVSGVYNGRVFGTLIHNYLDNPHLRDEFLKYIGLYNEREEIFKENEKIRRELKRRALSNKVKKIESKEKRGIILLSTSSNSGKTFLTTSISSKLKDVYVAKIGGDVRDIVPSLYILRDKMDKYRSIKLGERGWVKVEEFLDFVKKSNYKFFIVEGVMGSFTGALKNISSYQIAKKLNFPIYIVSSCNLEGIEGAFFSALNQYFFLKSIGLKVEGIILNKVYNIELFNKLKNLAKKYNIKLYYVEKIAEEKRGLIPEVEIDYDEFCKKALNINLTIDIPKLDFNNNREIDSDNSKDNFLDNLERWIKKVKD
ncbi:cobyrinic acid a,c-diamide synthase [Methanocaldococcus indicus]|uniref:cobyrinic acid a,c-diamide synthase n=1 Tax=Methanocaldococcus indicus TaxID=213231 RepID=UPI003C6D9D3F